MLGVQRKLPGIHSVITGSLSLLSRVPGDPLLPKYPGQGVCHFQDKHIFFSLPEAKDKILLPNRLLTPHV